MSYFLGFFPDIYSVVFFTEKTPKGIYVFSHKNQAANQWTGGLIGKNPKVVGSVTSPIFRKYTR